MGPERKPELQSSSEIEKTVQDTAVLIAQSERLVAELDELLKRAKALAEEQKAFIESYKNGKK